MDHLDDEVRKMLQLLDYELETIPEIWRSSEKLDLLLQEIQRTKAQLTRLHEMLDDWY